MTEQYRPVSIVRGELFTKLFSKQDQWLLDGDLLVAR